MNIHHEPRSERMKRANINIEQNVRWFLGILFIMIILMLIVNNGTSQDFNRMANHLNRIEEKTYEPREYVNESGDTVVTYYHLSYSYGDTNHRVWPDNMNGLRNKFFKIYKEEYLRYVAKEMLKAQFEPELNTVGYDTLWDYYQLMYEDSLIAIDSVMYILPTID